MIPELGRIRNLFILQTEKILTRPFSLPSQNVVELLRKSRSKLGLNECVQWVSWFAHFVQQETREDTLGWDI